MNIDYLDSGFKPHATLTVGNADWEKNEYLANQFLEILIAHMESIKVFMPNPEQHDKFIKAIDSHLTGLMFRVVDVEEHQKMLDEKMALERKFEKLKNELSV